MMKETPPTLTLEATTFNKPQLQEQLSVLEQRQEAQIALAGRSNVGKSSLVNALARRKQLAKISATPVDSPETALTGATSIRSTSSCLRIRSPISSSPVQAIKAISAPLRPAATAWLAPLPPKAT